MNDFTDIRNNIISVLKTVIDPDLNKDIVSAGFVKNVDFSENGKVSLTIELTIPTCPLQNKFKQEIEDKLKAIVGIREVEIKFTSRKHLLTQRTTINREQIQNIIAVSACKGGVGKSTVSAFLARALQRRNQRVGLLDLDIYGPSLPTLLNLSSPEVIMLGEKIIPVEVNGLKTMSLGYLLGDSPAVLRGPLASNYVIQILRQTEWEHLDFLIIDLPPGTGDIQITLVQQVSLDGALIVTTPHTLSLVDVARGILMFEKVQVPVLGIIENMSFFECDNCGKKHHIFGKGIDSLQNRFGITTLAQIPILKNFWDASKRDSGIEYETIWEELVEKLLREIGKRRANILKSPRIETTDKIMKVFWEDSTISEIPLVELRRACKCAYCVDELTNKPLLNPNTTPPNITILEINQLGHYAISVAWSDGHTSSIYPWDYLKSLFPPKRI
ncbi:MAG: P-loop NTPase [Candidatus Hydrogenedentes bacterium]|nr:P-loop NTPase [Candidatus Hydrogenedentota bacterium]